MSPPIAKALVLASVFVGLSADAAIVFDGTFSSGTFSQYSALEANGIFGKGVDYPKGIAGHLTLIDDPVVPSRTVMAATRLLGDEKTNGGYRSEVVAPLDPLASQRWYSAGFYLPDGWNAGSADVVVMQVLNTPDSFESHLRSPTLKVVVQGDTVRLINSYDYDAQTGNPGLLSDAGSDFTQRTLATWSVTPGQWVYLDIHANWAGDDSGSLEVWKNGASIFSEKHHINTFNDEGGVYFKGGNYAYPSPDWTSLTTYFTGVRIGDGNETLQTMSMVPEPSTVISMAAGIGVLFAVARRRQRCNGTPRAHVR